MLKTCGIDHIALNVSNLQNSVKFYKNVLGMKKKMVCCPGHVFMSDDFVNLCLGETSKKEKFDENKIGLNHIVLKTKAKNVIDILQKRKIKHETDGRFIVLRDPDGIRIELVEI